MVLLILVCLVFNLLGLSTYETLSFANKVSLHFNLSALSLSCLIALSGISGKMLDQSDEREFPFLFLILWIKQSAFLPLRLMIAVVFFINAFYQVEEIPSTTSLSRNVLLTNALSTSTQI